MREEEMSIACHLCEFVGHSKTAFDEHMMEHYDHKCPFCDYTSRTEGRLERHIKDFHSEIPPESWAGSRTARTSNGDASNSSNHSDSGSHSQMETGKPRKYRCKQCNFIAVSKEDFWAHTKSHIKSDKQLKCPECPFVTEYKHHLEYHLRNHYGSKPFKCEKCNYSCVNKSMLNSHLKSHSKVYQYRCADCSYATKYCHSLKQHLRKYTHKPSIVLNPDGTPNPYPIIDVYGTRRGPRPKKNKSENESMNDTLSANSSIHHDLTGEINSTKVINTKVSPSSSSPSLLQQVQNGIPSPLTMMSFMAGAPNPYPIMDVFGNRCGPLPKKNESENEMRMKEDESDDGSVTPDTMLNTDDTSASDKLCDEFVGHSKSAFEEHMMEHYGHKSSPPCNFTSSRTEGKIERQIKDFHSKIPAESWAGSRTARTSNGDASNSSNHTSLANELANSQSENQELPPFIPTSFGILIPYPFISSLMPPTSSPLDLRVFNKRQK